MSLCNIDALDSVKIRARENVFNLADMIRNYRVLLIGIPGAFTPVDTNVFMPELIQKLPYLDKMLDYIFCIVWNDPFVTKCWVTSMDVPRKIKVISDWNGYLTKSLGMSMDASEYYLGQRSKRYSAIYDSGKLLWSAMADNAYPQDIVNAMESFKEWNPSNADVDPCSNFKLDSSPKSKFLPNNAQSNTLAFHLGSDDEHSSGSVGEAPPSPKFKNNRLGDNARNVVHTRSMARGSFSVEYYYSEESQAICEKRPPASIPDFSSEASSESIVDVLSDQPKLPPLNLAFQMTSEEVYSNGYLTDRIDEMLTPLITSPRECSESQSSPRLINQNSRVGMDGIP